MYIIYSLCHCVCVCVCSLNHSEINSLDSIHIFVKLMTILSECITRNKNFILVKEDQEGSQSPKGICIYIN